MLRGGFVVAVMLAHAGCGSLDGNATGTCRVRYGADGAAPAIAGGERTDRVRVHVDEDHGVVTVRMMGCTLRMHATPAQANRNPHYLVDEGSTCTWDLPGLGRRTFPVANRPTPTGVTDGVGYDAFANFAGREVFLVLEAGVDRGRARFDCELERAR